MWLERGTRLFMLNQRIDPHKGSHTALALDDHELEPGSLRIRAEGANAISCSGRALRRAHLGHRVGERTGLSLLAAGERVLDVPATLASRVRVFSTDRSNKNDPNDASWVAVAALRSLAMTEVRCEDHATGLRLLAKRQIDLGRWRNMVCCRLHAQVAELVAGKSVEIVVA